jgi:hypothetical protein
MHVNLKACYAVLAAWICLWSEQSSSCTFSISFKETDVTGGMTKVDERDMTNQGTQGKISA